MEKTVVYYAADGSHSKFDKYTIDSSGVIRNIKNGHILSTRKKGEYNAVGLQDSDKKTRDILVGRALASTFYGKPPTLAHSADHIDRDPDNDTSDNIRWLCKSGQVINQYRPEMYKSAFIIVKDGEEKTANEWVKHMKKEKNLFGHEYTTGMLAYYAQKKRFGFSYKEYPDLEGEVWKGIVGSENVKGRWEISNTSRVKFITKHSENVLSGDRLGLSKGYPFIKINKKQLFCHNLAYQAFFPEEYSSKKPGELILHEDDDRMNFCPHKLRLGTSQENTADAYNNGKYDGTKTARMKCTSYIDGVLEKEYESQSDAIRYLKTRGYAKANCTGIRLALSNKYKTAYGRTWVKNRV